MAIFYSDTLSSNQMSTVYDSRFKPDPLKVGSRLRIASGHWTNGTNVTAAAEVTQHFIFLYTLRDTDRVWDLFAYGGGEETNVGIDIGIAQWYSDSTRPANNRLTKAYSDNFGLPSDADAFASLLTIGSSATNATSVFDEQGTTGRKRGQTISELTGINCVGNEWVIFALTKTNSAIDVANYNIGSFCYYTSQ